MSNVLQGLLPNKCLVYLDDVLIVGHNFEEHLNSLKEVLNAIQNAGLKLKPSKCHFGQTSVKFLGFQIADTGLAPDPEKVKAIKEYPVPKDKRSNRAEEIHRNDFVLSTLYIWI